MNTLEDGFGPEEELHKVVAGARDLEDVDGLLVSVIRLYGHRRLQLHVLNPRAVSADTTVG